MKHLTVTLKITVDPDEYFGAVDEGWTEDFADEVKFAVKEMGGVEVTSCKAKEKK